MARRGGGVPPSGCRARFFEEKTVKAILGGVFLNCILNNCTLQNEKVFIIK